MSKVLVDRDLLERALAASTKGMSDTMAARSELAAILAQPAEAEGVERWTELKMLAEKATPGPWVPFCKPRVQAIFGSDGQQPNGKGTVVDWPGFDSSDATSSQRKANTKFIAAANPAKVLELLAALSAVTAERDRLDAECGSLLESKVLDAETIHKLESERDQLRAEAEAEAEALRETVLCAAHELGLPVDAGARQVVEAIVGLQRKAAGLWKDAERYYKVRALWPPQFARLFDETCQGDVSHERYSRMDDMVDAMAAKEG